MPLGFTKTAVHLDIDFAGPQNWDNWQDHTMNNNRFFLPVFILLTTALLLPICACVILGVAALLDAMGDSIGGGVLRWIGLGCGILWTINLISLVLVQAIRSLPGPDDQPSEDDAE